MASTIAMVVPATDVPPASFGIFRLSVLVCGSMSLACPDSRASDCPGAKYQPKRVAAAVLNLTAVNSIPSSRLYQTSPRYLSRLDPVGKLLQ